MNTVTDPNHPEVNRPSVPSILDAALDERIPKAADALSLLEIEKDADLGRLRDTAAELRQRQNQDKTPVEAGFSLFLTNLDELEPSIYGYSRKPGDTGAYTLTVDEIDARLEGARARKLERVYVSGGGYWSLLQVPGLESINILKTYARVVAHLHEQCPELAIAGFSPDEIDFLSVVSGRSERYILEMLRDQGLQKLGGHGAEILVDEVRRKISPRKAKVRRWFDIAASACRIDLPVTLKVEAGHFETLRDRITHLERVRKFLDKHPGAFSEVIPQMSGPHEASRSDRQKLLAVIRLYLGDRIPRQHALWRLDEGHASERIMEEAVDGFCWGADTLGSTDALAYQAFLAGSRQAPDFSLSELQKLANG